MPIVAQELIPITITDNHTILIEQFKKCNCLNKSELINVDGYNKEDLMSTLDSLTSGGLISCDGNKCCVNSVEFGSFVDKLNKLK